jgi:ribosomal protein S18 acetylase RimI-like enzyme
MRFTIDHLEGALARKDLAEIGAVARDAFIDDPFFVFLSKNERLLRRGLPIFFQGFVKYLGQGKTISVVRHEGTIIAVAAWAAPGTFPPPIKDQLLQALYAFWALLPVPQALFHGTRYLLAMEKAHPKEEVWYLALLAVSPLFQRQGLGQMLMEPILASCDEVGYEVYLETQKEENLAYYRQVGFEETATLIPVPKGPPLWTMRRRAKLP